MVLIEFNMVVELMEIFQNAVFNMMPYPYAMVYTLTTVPNRNTCIFPKNVALQGLFARAPGSHPEMISVAVESHESDNGLNIEMVSIIGDVKWPAAKGDEAHV